MVATLLPIEDYYRLNPCCVSKYVKRVIDSGVKLTEFLISEGSLDGVASDSSRSVRFEFLEQLSSIGWCDECAPFYDSSNLSSEVVPSSGLS